MPTEIHFDEAVTQAKPAARVETALQGVTAVLQQVSGAGTTARRALSALQMGLRRTAVQAQKTLRGLAEFDELHRLSAAETAKSSTRRGSAAQEKAPAAWQAALQTLREQWASFWGWLTQLWQPLQQRWQKLWQGLAAAAAAVWQGLGEAARTAWQTYGQPLTTGARQALQGLADLLAALWAGTVQPVLQQLAALLGTLWREHLQPLWQQLLLALGAAGNLLLTLWNTQLAPLLSWLAAAFGPGVGQVLGGLAASAAGAAAAVADCIRIALTALQGLVEFLTNVLQGQWQAAWQGMAETVNNVWQQIVAMIQTAVSAAVSAVQQMFSGLAAIAGGLFGAQAKAARRGCAGGGSTMLAPYILSDLTSLPVPALAAGAVIPANREFLALLGDQPAGTNIEAPLDTIKQALAETLAAWQGSGAEQPINVYIGEEMLDTVIANSQRRRSTRSGGR